MDPCAGLSDTLCSHDGSGSVKAENPVLTESNLDQGPLLPLGFHIFEVYFVASGNKVHPIANIVSDRGMRRTIEQHPPSWYSL